MKYNVFYYAGHVLFGGEYKGNAPVNKHRRNNYPLIVQKVLPLY